MIIAIDCGSTNMRTRLYDGEVCVAEARRQAGVRNTAFDGKADFLRTALRECIEELLQKTRSKPEDIEVALSSGTLAATDVGIYPVPHIPAPAGLAETAAHAKLTVLPDITPIPILFIPGIKTMPGDDEPDEMRYIALLESMSGEDCETYGMMKLLGIGGPFTIALPGSYLKVLKVDAAGRITSLTTGMCGEFLAAMSEHTLLKSSLPHPLIQGEPDEKYLCMGYDYAGIHGISPSLIKGRMMPFLGHYDPEKAGNFFVGAALRDDVGLILQDTVADQPLYIGGSDPLRHVFYTLVRHAGVKAARVIEIDDETARLAPNIGALRVWEMYKKTH